MVGTQMAKTQNSGTQQTKDQNIFTIPTINSCGQYYCTTTSYRQQGAWSDFDGISISMVNNLSFQALPTPLLQMCWKENAPKDNQGM